MSEARPSEANAGAGGATGSSPGGRKAGAEASSRESLLLGRFEATGPVGMSAIGETRPAFDHELNREVVLTRLPAELTSSERLEKQLMMQVEILTQLRDDAIVRVLDYVTGERCGYLVEDRFDGQDLAAFLAQGGQLAPAEADAIGLEILRALDAAHAAGIIHRDLRPEHVWILDDGSIKVRGFGLARLLREQRTALNREVTNRARLVAYAPPEDLLHQGMDHRGDLYALGCILYELRTGRPPFVEGNVAYAHVHQVPQAPSELVASIEEPLEQVILGCLAKHPDERFQTAAEVRACLEVPAAAVGAGPPRRPRPLGLVAAAAVAVVAVAGAVFFYQHQRRQTPPDRAIAARAETARHKPRPVPASVTARPPAPPAAATPAAAPVAPAAVAPTPAAPAPAAASEVPSPPGPPAAPTPEERFAAALAHAAQQLGARRFAAALDAYQEAGKLVADRAEVSEGISHVYALWGDALAAQGRLLEAQETYRLGLRFGEESRDRLLAIRDRIHESIGQALRITLAPPGPLLTAAECEIQVHLGQYPVKEVRLGAEVAPPDAEGVSTFACRGLAEGDHTFRIEIRDHGDNLLVRELAVHVDTRPPTIAAFEPRSGAVLEASQVVVRGEASEPIAAVWCEPEKQDVTLEERRFTFTVPVSGLHPELSFAVEDRAGHRSEITRIQLHHPGWVPPELEPRGDKFFSLKDRSYMVRVPGVEFVVRDGRGRPRRSTTEPFFVDVTEVTNAQYRRFLEWSREAAEPRRYSHPSEPTGKDRTPAFWGDPALAADDLPVVGVDWWDAYAYARWAGKSLMTDATWVLAARGVPEAVYPWGDGAPQRHYANYLGSDAAGPLPVMSLAQGRSPFGCHDMAGNVMEWCLEPHPEAGGYLVRGGSWFHSPEFLRVNTRVGYPPVLRTKFLGLRCARYLAGEAGVP